jgi:putative flippase GtrA
MIDRIFLLKFFKFCIVGFSGMAIDFGTTWLFKERLKINKYIANSAGFIFATSWNFAFNRFWTFHSLYPQVAMQYLVFLSISVVGLGLNNLIVYILHGRLRLNFYLAKLVAVAIVTVWNFLMNYFFTFR